MADALQLDWTDYFSYTLASYLLNRMRGRAKDAGCTAWAASNGVTVGGIPVLAKNRDYFPEHLPLQCLARVRPAHGHPYICLTSAGSPGVFSSGINATGLATADTYVSSTDVGPGIARYSVMMDLLEQSSTVAEATSYLPTKPHLGDGTITVADRHGNMAVLEIAHAVQGVVQPNDGFIVSTNHFVAPETRERWVDNEPLHLQGNSEARREAVASALRASQGQVDVTWAERLMGRHGSALDAICRHAEIDRTSATISTAILLPQQTAMYVANGSPCTTAFERFGMNEEGIGDSL
jgi:hypothetical protein